MASSRRMRLTATTLVLVAAAVGGMVTAAVTTGDRRPANAEAEAGVAAPGAIEMSISDCGSGWAPGPAGAQAITVHNADFHPGEVRVLGVDPTQQASGLRRDRAVRPGHHGDRARPARGWSVRAAVPLRGTVADHRPGADDHRRREGRPGRRPDPAGPADPGHPGLHRLGTPPAAPPRAADPVTGPGRGGGRPGDGQALVAGRARRLRAARCGVRRVRRPRRRDQRVARRPAPGDPRPGLHRLPPRRARALAPGVDRCGRAAAPGRPARRRRERPPRRARRPPSSTR